MGSNKLVVSFSSDQISHILNMNGDGDGDGDITDEFQHIGYPVNDIPDFEESEQPKKQKQDEVAKKSIFEQDEVDKKEEDDFGDYQREKMEENEKETPNENDIEEM